MRILISGATGFLGRHLILHLNQSKENNILGLTSKITIKPYDKNSAVNFVTWNLLGAPDRRTKQIIDEFCPDMIIHAAVASSSNMDGSSWIKNITMTEYFLSNIPRNVQLIYISSADVYSRKSLFFGADENSPTSPSNVYGLSKLCCENLCRLALNENKLKNLQIIRPTAFTGQYATHGLVYDIVKKLLGNIPNLELMGIRPGSIKPIMHVDDLIKSILHISNIEYHYGIYNLSNKTINNVESIAEKIMSVLKINKFIIFNNVNSIGDNNVVYVKSDYKCLLDTLDAVDLAAREIYDHILFRGCS